jgi:hypothetical protein
LPDAGTDCDDIVRPCCVKNSHIEQQLSILALRKVQSLHWMKTVDEMKSIRDEK